MDSIRDIVRGAIGEALVELPVCCPKEETDDLVETIHAIADAVFEALGIEDAEQDFPLEESRVLVQRVFCGKPPRRG